MRGCLRLVAVSVGSGVLPLRLRDGEQLTCSRDVLGTLAAGEQAVVANAMEAVGKHMDQEATDELVCGECHRLVSIAAFDAVILPPEGDAIVVERDQAAVGDGHAVGVARPIGEYSLGPAERALCIDDPFGFAQRRQIGREGPYIGERSVVAEELELAVYCRELLQEQPAEQA